MTPEIALVFALLLSAALLFATEKVRPDVVAMGVLVILLLTNLIDSESAFGAFSNSAVIVLGSVFVLSEGLAQTGFATLVARRILALAGESERRLILLLMLAGAGLSAFMHNTGVAAIFLPAVLALAQQSGRSPSRLLFPLSIAILAGGSLTLVGTAPNILVNESMRARGLEGFGFFAFAPVAAPILLALIVGILLFYDRLFPERSGGASQMEGYRLREYLTELHVHEESVLVGRKLADLYQSLNGQFRLIGLVRDEVRVFAPPPALQMRPNDVLVVRGRLDDLHEIRESWGLGEEPVRAESLTDGGELALAEVTLAPRSSLAGQTIVQGQVRSRYGLTVLGICRKGVPLSRRLGEVKLQYGDLLLVQGARPALGRVQEEHDLLLLQEVRAPLARPRKARLAVAILIAVVLLIVFKILPTAVALFVGAGAMVLTGCLTMERAYEIIDWRTLFIVAGMLPLGEVMERTGSAQLIAETLLRATGDASPYWLLAGLFLVTMLLSEVVSNDVSTLLVIPLALSLASAAGYSPLPFLMMVAIAAGSPFLTPMSHGPNLLIMGPGHYRFRDFTRVGLPVSLLIGGIALVVIPMLFPF